MQLIYMYIQDEIKNSVVVRSYRVKEKFDGYGNFYFFSYFGNYLSLTICFKIQCCVAIEIPY